MNHADAKLLCELQVKTAAACQELIEVYDGLPMTPKVLAGFKHQLRLRLAEAAALIHVWDRGNGYVGCYVGVKERGHEYLSAPPDGICEVFNGECPEVGWYDYDPMKHTKIDPELIFRRKRAGREHQ